MSQYGVNGDEISAICVQFVTLLVIFMTEYGLTHYALTLMKRL